MLFRGRIYITLGPWHFENFCNIFLPNIGKEQKQNIAIRARGPVPYGKSGPSHCITFITRLNEGLRLQLLGQKPLILPCLCI